MANPAAPADSAAPATAPPKSSNLRLFILLGLLVVAIGLLIFDYKVAAPALEDANAKIEKLVEERNKQAVQSKNNAEAGADLVRASDIQQAIGRAPSSVQEFDDYTIEAYAFGGLWPVWKRHYITVLYVGGDEKSPRRYSTHHKNTMPPEEFLPSSETLIDIKPGTDEVPQSLPQPGVMESEEDKANAEKGSKGVEAPGPAAPGPATEEKPAEEQPSEEKPAEDKPAEEKPAE